MSRPQVYSWIAADAAAVSALQTLAGAGSFRLNGTLGDPIRYTLPVVFAGISRVVTLTSTGNISAVNFTITGTLKGVAVSETRVGPNNNTVVTTQLFDTVTSVTTDAAVATNTRIGTGQTGNTQWAMFDYDRTVANMAIQVVVTGTINYSFQVTLDDALNVTPNVATPVAGVTGATTSQLAVYTTPIRFFNIIVNSSTTTATLSIIFVQQGQNI